MSVASSEEVASKGSSHVDLGFSHSKNSKDLSISASVSAGGGESGTGAVTTVGSADLTGISLGPNNVAHSF